MTPNVQTLTQRLAAGRLPLNDALRCASQIVDALRHAHEEGYCHGALAPGSVILSPTAGLLGLVATGAFVVWMWRRRGQAGRIVMSVESGDLIVQAGRRSLARMRLEDLEDVALDTKAIRPVQEGGSAIPAVRFIDSKVGPEIDVSRIVLVGGGSSVRLHEAHVAHMTATEWLGKIRVFLRKNGWVPLDEMDPKSAG